ncbi:hypothetical protein [Bradyrhizobium sp. Tv2a-2]|uniref:hypothetical protein n=1 Tax=Bradyrhizobium sp. Tv2a-2 TaxID=113395 RepID=UPI000413E82B|nr:hypothetical protein [Bradyrhizobium sp. Tv2a-2]
MSDPYEPIMKEALAMADEKLKLQKRVFEKNRDPLEALVSKFSAALLEKLRTAEKKYGYNNDWMRDNWEAECQKHLAEHLAKGDPRDVAAYAAFCWHHGWPTAPRQS